MLVLIAYKNPNADNPACRHSGLGITASNLCEVLNDNGMPAISVPVANGEAVWALLASRADVTHVVLCAPFFDTPYLERMCRHFPHVKFTVTYHSNWGFLQQDSWAVKCLVAQMQLQSSIRNFRISGNSEDFTGSTTAAFGVAISMLPNLYWQHGPVLRARQPWRDGDLHIGIFGATRVLKNVLTGAVAAMAIGRVLKAQRTFVHTSSGRVEHGDGVMDNVRRVIAAHKTCELIEEPWAQWPDFRLQVRQMHLLLQPSYTETFNNVTADGVCEGVPSVVSDPIDWVPADWHASPDDARDVAAVGCNLIRCSSAAIDGYEALAAHNRSGIAAWRNWVSER